MPYDSSLDSASFKETVEFADSRITVGVFSYNGGEKKLQITRENRNQADEWRFSKLGRMTKPEIEQITPIIAKATEQM